MKMPPSFLSVEANKCYINRHSITVVNYSTVRSSTIQRSPRPPQNVPFRPLPSKMCQQFPINHKARLQRREKDKQNKNELSMREATQEGHSLASESGPSSSPPISQDVISRNSPSPPCSPCTLGLIPTPPATPSPMFTPDLSEVPKLPPPTRSSWTPFSYASFELNLLARPDYENVCQAIYQSFYLGALNPNQNPYPVVLPKPGTITSLNIKDDSLPGDEDKERLNDLVRSIKIRDYNDQGTEVGEEIVVEEVVERDEIEDVPIAPTDVGSAWSNFVFDPTPSKSKPVSPEKQDKIDRNDPGSPGNSIAPLQEMFCAKVPMTPVRARKGSKFVSTNDNAVYIQKLAYAQDNGNGAQILCKAVINPSYTPDVGTFNPGRTVPTLTYVGFEYSDQTCLTYIPIMDTRLLYKGMKKERSFGEEVPMMMKRSVFEKIKEMSIRVYLEAHPGTRIDCGIAEMQGKYVTTGVMVKSNRTVKIELEHRSVYRPALETLNMCKHDIHGEALLHVRFSKSSDKDLAQLRFILFGIQISRTSENRGLKIFEIVENDRHDGHEGAGW